MLSDSNDLRALIGGLVCAIAVGCHASQRVDGSMEPTTASGAMDAGDIETDLWSPPSQRGNPSARDTLDPAAGAGASCDDLTTEVEVVKACAQMVDAHGGDADAGAADGEDAGAGSGADQARSVELTGTVEEVVRGSWDCSAAFGRGDVYPELGDRPWRFRVSDGSRNVWVGVLLPWRTPLVEVGDRVSVEFGSLEHFGGGGWSHLLVRREDGSLLLWVGDATQTSELEAPPEVLIRTGVYHCGTNRGCGLVDRRGYFVRIGDDETSLAYGQRAAVGAFTVLHLGNDVPGGFRGGGCFDWAPGHAAVAVVRGTPLELGARDRGECGERSSCSPGQYCTVPDAAACDRTDVDATCAEAPSSCELDCPGVCGCDGRFYCNACRAAKAGVDVAEGDSACMAVGGCPHGNASAGEGIPCRSLWSCFGQHYEIDCHESAEGARCACLVDGEVTEEIDNPSLANCEREGVIAACGFPSPLR